MTRRRFHSSAASPRLQAEPLRRGPANPGSSARRDAKVHRYKALTLAKGSKTEPRNPAKSSTLRVAAVRPAASAVARMKESRSSIGRPLERPRACRREAVSAAA